MAGIIIFLAGIGQSAIGFGYALFSSPLLVWIGIPLPQVIALVATCSMFQAIIGSRKLNTSVPWRLSLIATIVRLASVIIGLWLLKLLVNLNIAFIRMLIGVVICLIATIQIIWRPKPVDKLHWSWGGIAFSSSGLLAGLFGMGGPPLVLWSMTHNWTNQKTRGFLFAVFAMSIPVQILLLSFTFGLSILWNVVIGIAFLPLIYLGTMVGLPLGNRISKDKLKLIAYVVLLIIGVSAVVPVLFSQWN